MNVAVTVVPDWLAATCEMALAATFATAAAAADSFTESAALQAACFEPGSAEVYRHDKGHAMPCRQKDVDAYCAWLGHFAERLLTPAPAESAHLFGPSYGGGAPTSKHNVQAFNLQLLPNDGTLWSMDVPTAFHRVASLDALDRSATCLQGALEEWAARSSSTPPSSDLRQHRAKRGP